STEDPKDRGVPDHDRTDVPDIDVRARLGVPRDELHLDLDAVGESVAVEPLAVLLQRPEDRTRDLVRRARRRARRDEAHATAAVGVVGSSVETAIVQRQFGCSGGASTSPSSDWNSASIGTFVPSSPAQTSSASGAAIHSFTGFAPANSPASDACN